MSEDEDSIDKRLSVVLAEHGVSQCRRCGRIIDRGDLAWDSGLTGGGTEFSQVVIICQRCDTQVAIVERYGELSDSLEDVIATVLENDLAQWWIER